MSRNSNNCFHINPSYSNEKKSLLSDICEAYEKTENLRYAAITSSLGIMLSVLTLLSGFIVSFIVFIFRNDFMTQHPSLYQLIFMQNGELNIVVRLAIILSAFLDNVAYASCIMTGWQTVKQRVNIRTFVSPLNDKANSFDVHNDRDIFLLENQCTILLSYKADIDRLKLYKDLTMFALLGVFTIILLSIIITVVFL